MLLCCDTAHGVGVSAVRQREAWDVKNASTKQEGRREGKSKAGRGYDVKDAGINRGGEE